MAPLAVGSNFNLLALKMAFNKRSRKLNFSQKLGKERKQAY